MTIPKPTGGHAALMKVAAELVRGPSLDERFELDERLPKWALRNIERIEERLRVLGCAVRDGADKLKRDLDAKDAEIERLRGHVPDQCSALLVSQLQAVVDVQDARIRGLEHELDVSKYVDTVERLKLERDTARAWAKILRSAFKKQRANTREELDRAGESYCAMSDLMRVERDGLKRERDEARAEGQGRLDFATGEAGKNIALEVRIGKLEAVADAARKLEAIYDDESIQEFEVESAKRHDALLEALEALDTAAPKEEQVPQFVQIIADNMLKTAKAVSACPRLKCVWPDCKCKRDDDGKGERG